MTGQPRILRVGEEPPPLESDKETTPQHPKGTSTTKGKAGHRFQVINAFADHTLAVLNRAEMAVWVLLWRDTRPNGLARASQADLARRAGVNARTVKRAISSLQKSGLVTVVRRGGLFRGPSTYRVNPLKGPARQAG
jgi:hypothetical protein